MALDFQYIIKTMSENSPKPPPITSAEIRVHYKTIDGVEYGCCYWNAIKHKVPKDDYVDEDNLKHALWEEIWDVIHMEEELMRLKPPTKIAEEI